ncbi:hypothetical protein M3603_11790 [Rummeliibacillus stabekisii]|uniref:hypothetical protein n=1 Tax=Rummeliibacillus stabekisii TaxID=241244 RepID=UPI00203E783F|nr:hypothetical protein [Rummeliibacillus stabekisii]MCM3317327.1 hypothetical protein [Rummeliibacillus stabekisii]
MSKRGSESEFIFSLGLKNNKELLEKVLGLELVEAKLEKNYPGVEEKFKIDIYAVEKNSNNPVFVENVLTTSDDYHQETLLKLINHIQTGIIVYQALDFKKEHVRELRNAVKGKAINLYFVKINISVIDFCRILNSRVHKLKIFNYLYMFNKIPNSLELLTELNIIKPLKEYIAPVEEKVRNMERYEINTYLMNKLRSKIPYYFSFQREKSNIDIIPTLKFGAGKADTSLNISVSSKRMAFVELSFAKNSRKIYHMIKVKEEIARKIIGKDLEFVDKKHKITFRFKPSENLTETVDSLVAIVEKFIQAFANYTYYPDNPAMWEKFDYSL